MVNETAPIVIGLSIRSWCQTKGPLTQPSERMELLMLLDLPVLDRLLMHLLEGEGQSIASTGTDWTDFSTA